VAEAQAHATDAPPAKVAKVARVARVARVAKVAKVARVVRVAKVAKVAKVARVARVARVAKVVRVVRVARVAKVAKVAKVVTGAAIVLNPGRRKRGPTWAQPQPTAPLASPFRALAAPRSLHKAIRRLRTQTAKADAVGVVGVAVGASAAREQMRGHQARRPLRNRVAPMPPAQ
jgi:peptidyl-prolyl cis-trans isomerase SurA